MSHIYEALQRAEAERKSAPIQENERVDAESANVVLPPNESLFEAVTEASQTTIAPKVIPSFLSNIPRKPWKPSLELLPALQKGGSSVEQFRSLRSRIQEFRDLKKLKSLLVSSGLPKEGKSFVAVNLAVNLARHKSSKVLLIDGDMRCSNLHRYLGCEIYPGLPEYLTGKASILEVMQYPEETAETDPATAAVLSNLAFIPGGAGGDKAADLSDNKRFEELLSTAAPYFDWIIVDSPPVLLVSDAVNLARSCDAVLLVARSGVTTFPVAQRAQHELKASNIIGFVLNAVHNPPVIGNYYRYDGQNE